MKLVAVVFVSLLVANVVLAKPVSYDLDFQSGELKLQGTLLEPEKSIADSVVIFIHGSGPVSRDGISRAQPNDPPIFKQIAELLVERGVASFRFDKRLLTYDAKNPPWDKEKFTPLDLIADVQAAIKFVKSRDGYTEKKVILISHSEGGIFVPTLVARDESVSGAILLSPAF